MVTCVMEQLLHLELHALDRATKFVFQQDSKTEKPSEKLNLQNTIHPCIF